MMAHSRDISQASTELQDFISTLDVDATGIISLDECQGTKLEESALKLLPTARSVVVLTMEIYAEILALTSTKRVMGAASMNELADSHADYLSGRLTRAAYDIAHASRKAGLKALTLPSRGCPTDARFLEAVLSYKHASQAAGLGYIGRSSLLITPEFGPRVRLAGCLTEAILKSTTADHHNECESCNICINNCPSGALAEPQHDELYVINKFACQAFRRASGGCSECMRLCPAGQ
ncbi:hypothetical protein ACFLV0_00935 [Chloroflexota bacterium]